MQARGYPLADFDQGAADISVNHPRLMEDYRSSHGVAMRAGSNGTSTEDLRTAMLQYRALFDELVETKTPGEVQSVARAEGLECARHPADLLLAGCLSLSYLQQLAKFCSLIPEYQKALHRAECLHTVCGDPQHSEVRPVYGQK
jgi:hypothetical protein